MAGINADDFRRLTRYNRWANTGSMKPARHYRRKTIWPRGPPSSARSTKTLNRILVADRIWLGGFERRSSEIKRLDQSLCEDFAALQEVREAENPRILAFADGLSDAALADTLAYRSMAGEDKRTPLAWAVAHLLNHQTRHRGQVPGMLSGPPVPPPPLDLLYLLPENRA